MAFLSHFSVSTRTFSVRLPGDACVLTFGGVRAKTSIQCLDTAAIVDTALGLDDRSPTGLAFHRRTARR